MKPEKFDAKKEDDLYAWSNVRSEYNAGASYAVRKERGDQQLRSGTIGQRLRLRWIRLGGYGSGGYFGPGWYYNGLWNSWAWMPATGHSLAHSVGDSTRLPISGMLRSFMRCPGRRRTQTGIKKPVPVNPQHPPAVGAVAASPCESGGSRSGGAILRALAASALPGSPLQWGGRAARPCQRRQRFKIHGSLRWCSISAPTGAGSAASVEPRQLEHSGGGGGHSVSWPRLFE